MRTGTIPILIICLLLLAASPALAHSGELHPSDLEKVVSGVGLILVALTVASLFIRRNRETDGSALDLRDELRRERDKQKRGDVPRAD